MDNRARRDSIIAIFSTALALNLTVVLAYLWKPTEIEHPVVCFIIWAITEAYLVLFVYVNVFKRKSKKSK